MLPAVNGQIQLEAQAKTRTFRFTLKEKFTFLSKKKKKKLSQMTQSAEKNNPQISRLPKPLRVIKLGGSPPNVPSSENSLSVQLDRHSEGIPPR